MSEFRIDQIKNQAGTSGLDVAGITTFTGSSGIVMPSGVTGQRASDEDLAIVRDGLTLHLNAKYNGYIYDLTGNRNDGELVFGGEWKDLNGGAWFLDNTAGSSSVAGERERIEIQFQTALPPSPLSPFTLEVWAQRAASDAWQTVISLGQVGTQIAFDSSNVIRMGRNGGSGGHNATTGVTSSVDTWYHLVMTYDGNQSTAVSATDSEQINKIYINQYVNNVNYNPYGGDPLNPGSDNDMGYNGTDNDTRFALGTHAINAYPNVAEVLDGYIGEVRIYDRALTKEEISINYNATKFRYLGV